MEPKSYFCLLAIRTILANTQTSTDKQEMNNKITATFVCKRFHDSGKDQVPDYYVYEFTDIVDDDGNRLDDRWIKETKLMKEVPFRMGKNYEIILSNRSHAFNSVNLPFPKEITWDSEKIYIKGGNSIVLVSEGKEEENLSASFDKISGASNYETAASNKLVKGLMTEELLLKMNARQIFYKIEFCDPQDKRKSSGVSFGHSSSKNQVIIRKETQLEIDQDLEMIKRNYVTKSIEKYFSIETEILKHKKKIK